jgi:hypothetical protein
MQVLPDDWFAEPAAICSTKLDSTLKKKLRELPHLFILQPGYKIKAKSFVQMDEGELKGSFWLRLKLIEGGLELSLPKCYEEGGFLCLRSGSLHIPLEYYDHKKKVWRKPTAEERGYYEELKKIIRKNLTKIPQKYKTVLGGKNAKELLERGDAKITDYGF